ncbi:hypothetical protein FACS1894147_00540 [Spirochaetia bacterium]|nr:hypothetical protein FACS1894147_00540 [Spirochaetia bacterium]
MKKAALCVVMLTLALAVAGAQQKYALVIGNGNYQKLTKLKNPENDANDMKTALQGLGFTVDTLINSSRVQMEQGVERFKNRLSVSKDSYGFLFYAGHGVQSRGINYLIPVDADIMSEAYLGDRAVSVQAMLDEINQAGNELNIVVLDACRDNPFGWGRSGSRGLQVVSNQPADSIIVYATSAGSVAADGEGRNGVFTSQLLRNIKTPGLEVSEIFRLTMGDVVRASNGQQRPAVYNQFPGIAYLGSKPAAVAPTPTPTPAPTPAPTPSPSAQTIPANMVRINGGTFMMGSPTSEIGREGSYDETQHRVTVSGFYMGKYEVTQKEYQAVMGKNPSRFKGDKLPVEKVSWYDAIEYCNKLSEREGLTPAYIIDKTHTDPNNKNEYDKLKWLVSWNRTANGYRLPTEAEWEYACRAGTTGPFNTGNNITTSQANYNGNYPYSNNSKGTYRGRTTDVGSFAPNSWGLYDMHGNVSEWCWDWPSVYIDQTDPVGASAGWERVGRGGGFGMSAGGLRSAYRGGYVPHNNQLEFLGFRLVRSSL